MAEEEEQAEGFDDLHEKVVSLQIYLKLPKKLHRFPSRTYPETPKNSPKHLLVTQIKNSKYQIERQDSEQIQEESILPLVFENLSYLQSGFSFYHDWSPEVGYYYEDRVDQR